MLFRSDPAAVFPSSHWNHHTWLVGNGGDQHRCIGSRVRIGLRYPDRGAWRKFAPTVRAPYSFLAWSFECDGLCRFVDHGLSFNRFFCLVDIRDCPMDLESSSAVVGEVASCLSLAIFGVSPLQMALVGFRHKGMLPENLWRK